MSCIGLVCRNGFSGKVGRLLEDENSLWYEYLCEERLPLDLNILWQMGQGYCLSSAFPSPLFQGGC